jgi:hypothetical protein
MFGVESLKNLLPAGSTADGSINHDTLIKEFFELHTLQKEYFPSCIGFNDGLASEMLTQAGRMLVLTSVTPTFTFGNVSVVDHLSAGNGQIFVIDHAIQTKFTSQTSLDAFCRVCDENAFCEQHRPLQGCPGGCFAQYDTSCLKANGGDCPATSTEGDVCGDLIGEDGSKNRKSYKSACVAECTAGVTVVDDTGVCPLSKCSCKIGWTGDGKTCKPVTTTKVPRTAMTTTTIKADGHLMPQYHFYMNGSYDFVIGGRTAMRARCSSLPSSPPFPLATGCYDFCGWRLDLPSE